MSYPTKQRSNWWFLLPILLGIVGGVIAFFVIRNDDAKKATNCLLLGIIFFGIGLVLNILTLGMIPQLDSGIINR